MLLIVETLKGLESYARQGPLTTPGAKAFQNFAPAGVSSLFPQENTA